MDENTNSNVTEYRLSVLEKEVSNLKESSTSTALALTRFELKQDDMIKTVENLTTAVNTLKDKPMKEFNTMKVTVISTLVGSGILGTIGFLIGKILGN